MMRKDEIKEFVRRCKSVHNTDKVDEIVIGSGIVLSGLYIDKELDNDMYHNFKGTYRKIDGQKYIFYNNDIDENLQNEVIFHEYSHSCFHSDLNVDFLKRHTLFNIGKYERQADTACAEFFITDSFIEEHKYETVKVVASMLGITEKLVHLKLANYDMSKLSGYDDIIP